MQGWRLVWFVAADVVLLPNRRMHGTIDYTVAAVRVVQQSGRDAPG
jgi:hypothetical protein